MKRLTALTLLSLIALSACNGPLGPRGPILNGMYTGRVYSSGYLIGAMGIDVSTKNGQLSGVACLVGIDGSSACNTLSGTLSGTQARFTIGGLHFAGETNGSYIDTTFRDGPRTLSGSVYFTRDTSSVQGMNAPTIGDNARELSESYLRSFAASLQQLSAESPPLSRC